MFLNDDIFLVKTCVLPCACSSISMNCFSKYECRVQSAEPYSAHRNPSGWVQYVPRDLRSDLSDVM
ncbi:hypothetical protein Mapa_006235 [Marchantia paleacea]|nr:hypothetical protein Mapa_006235 [Marchantia paleacea]